MRNKISDTRMDNVIKIVGVAIVCVLCALGTYLLTRADNATPPPEPEPKIVYVQQTAAPTDAPPTPAPTPAPTTAPPPTVADILYYPGYYTRYGLAPLPPVPPPRWQAPGMVPVALVPGAAWPSLAGRSRDTVVAYLMSTYPRLTVRAVPYGTAVGYAVRDDRVTVLYDPVTMRVVTARIG